MIDKYGLDMNSFHGLGPASFWMSSIRTWMTTLVSSKTHTHSLSFTSHTHKHQFKTPEVSSIALLMADQTPSFSTSRNSSTNSRDEKGDNQPNSQLLNFVNELFECVPGHISAPGVSSPRARIFNPSHLRLNQDGLDLTSNFLLFL